ncbi:MULTISPECIES: Imm63 family immunity protein [Pantoea]|uniref:Imm63 family immunity protein n=1 Tax=Pantoea TaxID=53335 RepID=UPI000BB54662|nr:MULTISPECIES: Imm63 family immunity protein [Pantoea]PNK65161.1 hypothetical protein A6J33_021395 [Pantoea sp. FDAARGOS_194]
MLLSIDDLQKKVDGLVSILGFPVHSINLCSAPIGDGTPYISFENGIYNYIYSERGVEFSRRITDSTDELLYWIMYDFVHAVAVEYELNNRIPGKDCRRIYFPKIIELMSKINIDWGIKSRKHLEDVLADSPYDDSIYL